MNNDNEVTVWSTHEELPSLLYCNWKVVIGRSLRGDVHDTCSAGLPNLAALVIIGGVISVGTMKEQKMNWF